MGDPALDHILAGSRQGVLATVKSDGYPQLSNVFYVWEPEERIARVSTTARRVKTRAIRANPHAALHVAGEHFWAYAVAEGQAELSAVSATPSDPVLHELFELYSVLFGPSDRRSFADRMIDEQRLIIRLRVTRVYGLARAAARTDVRGPAPR